MRRMDCRDHALRASNVQVAASTARRGELIVLPTESSYVVACDAFAPGALDRLVRAKGRPLADAVPVMVGSTRGLDAIAASVTSAEKAFVGGFWPGPLTVICRSQPSLRWDAGRSTVALRMPLHPLALELLQAVGPMVVIAANRSGEPVPTDCDSAVEQLGDSVALYLDGGPCPPGPSSSIVDLTQPAPRILREGAISAETLVESLPSLAPPSEPVGDADEDAGDR